MSKWKVTFETIKGGVETHLLKALNEQDAVETAVSKYRIDVDDLIYWDAEEVM